MSVELQELRRSFFTSCKANATLADLRLIIHQNPRIIERRSSNWRHALYTNNDLGANAGGRDEEDDLSNDNDYDLDWLIIDPCNSCILSDRADVLMMLLRDYASSFRLNTLSSCVTLRNREMLSILLDYCNYFNLKVLLIRIVSMDALELLDMIMERGLLSCERIYDANLFYYAFNACHNWRSRVGLRLVQYLKDHGLLDLDNMRKLLKYALRFKDYQTIVYLAETAELNVVWKPSNVSDAYDKELVNIFAEVQNIQVLKLFLQRIYISHRSQETSSWVRDLNNHKIILDTFLDIKYGKRGFLHQNLQFDETKQYLFDHFLECTPWILCVFNCSIFEDDSEETRLYHNTLVHKLLHYQDYPMLEKVQKILENLVADCRPFAEFLAPSPFDNALIKNIVVTDPTYLLQQLNTDKGYLFWLHIKLSQDVDDVDAAFEFYSEATWQTVRQLPFDVKTLGDNTYYLEDYMKIKRNKRKRTDLANASDLVTSWSIETFASSFPKSSLIRSSESQAFHALVQKSSVRLYLTLLGLCNEEVDDLAGVKRVTISAIRDHMMFAVTQNNTIMTKVIGAQLSLLLEYHLRQKTIARDEKNSLYNQWLKTYVHGIVNRAVFSENCVSFEMLDFLWTSVDDLVQDQNAATEPFMKKCIYFDSDTYLHEILIEEYEENLSTSRFKDALGWCAADFGTNGFVHFLHAINVNNREDLLGYFLRQMFQYLLGSSILSDRSRPKSAEIQFSLFMRHYFTVCDVYLQRYSLANSADDEETKDKAPPLKRPRQDNPYLESSRSMLPDYDKFDKYIFCDTNIFLDLFSAASPYVLDVLHSRMLLLPWREMPYRLYTPKHIRNSIIPIEAELIGDYPDSEGYHSALWPIVYPIYHLCNLYALELLVAEALCFGGARAALFLLAIRSPRVSTEDGLFVCRVRGHREMEAYIIKQRAAMLHLWRSYESTL